MPLCVLIAAKKKISSHSLKMERHMLFRGPGVGREIRLNCEHTKKWGFIAKAQAGQGPGEWKNSEYRKILFSWPNRVKPGDSDITWGW
jgi:hypothetical protein